MKYTFERTLAPAMASPAIAFYSNIVGATAFNSGSASHISGIVAAGDTLTFTLVHPQGEFVTLLALPFACAVPTTLPMTEAAAPVPTAGPYYVSEHVYGDHLVALRNPNYHGPRPSRFDSLEYSYTHTQQEIRQRIEAGTSDYSPDIAAADQGELAQLYGPDSAAAGRGFQQWYSNPLPCTALIPLNTERPLFADANLRKAVNFAIDRTAIAAASGPTAMGTTDQLLPPVMPGFRDEQIYPNHSDLAQARQLAGCSPAIRCEARSLYYRTSGTAHLVEAQLLRASLEQIGIEPAMVGFAGGDIYSAISHRGEPFDLAIGVGWCEDYHDPLSFMQLIDGSTIHDGDFNNNWSYFNDAGINARLNAATQLVGQPRYDAFGRSTWTPPATLPRLPPGASTSTASWSRAESAASSTTPITASISPPSVRGPRSLSTTFRSTSPLQASPRPRSPFGWQRAGQPRLCGLRHCGWHGACRHRLHRHLRDLDVRRARADSHIERLRECRQPRHATTFFLDLATRAGNPRQGAGHPDDQPSFRASAASALRRRLRRRRRLRLRRLLRRSSRRSASCRTCSARRCVARPRSR